MLIFAEIAVFVLTAATAAAQFATDFEPSQSSGTPAYTAGGTIIGTQDIQAPTGNKWLNLFGTNSAMTLTSAAPDSGSLAFQIQDTSGTAANGAYVDFAGLSNLDLTQPFTIAFSMNLANVSANTNNQAQVYLGAPSTNIGAAKYWMAFIYNNGSFNLYVSNAAGNGAVAVAVGKYSAFAKNSGYVKVSITIDPALKKYTRVVISGRSGSADYTTAVQAVNGGVIPWLPASGPAVPGSNLVFVTGTDDTLKVKFDSVQISPATQWFEAFAPGVLLPDQGTIELTATLTRPIGEFGNSTGYDFLFKAMPAQALTTGKTLFGLYIPAAFGGTGLFGLARNNSGSVYANAPGFAPAVGTPFRVAMTWGNSVKLFVNGTQVASTPSSIGTIGPIPAFFRLERLDPFSISEVKVSDVALTTVSGDPAVPFTSDTHTTMLATKKLTRTQYFHSARLASLGYSSLTPRWRPEDQALVEGTTPSYNLVGVNHSGTTNTYSVRLTATDHTGAIVLDTTSSVSVAGDNAYHVTSIPLTGLTGRGYYEVRADIAAPGGAVASFDSSLALFPPNDVSVADGEFDHYLGYHYPMEDCSPVVLNRMGIKTNRVFGDLSGFYWYSVQPNSGTGSSGFTWTRTDLMVDSARAAGIDLLGILGNPPPWAAADPGSSYKNNPNNLPFSLMSGRWKPASGVAWNNYIHQVVSRYKDTVKNWEIWNEVDWHPPGHGYSFSGMTSEYFDLLLGAYSNAKTADSSSNVLISGFGMSSTGDPNMPYELLNSGASAIFDTFNSHGYNSDQVAALNAALYAAKGIGAPHWMTEQMWDSIGYEEDRLFLTIFLYLRYIDQGVDRFYQFGFEGLCFNLITQGPTIDAFVHAVFQSQLRKAAAYQGKYSFGGAGVFGIRHYFTRTDGKTLSILGQELTYNRITVAGTIVSAIDIHGQNVPTVVSGGNTTLDIKNVAYIVSASPLAVTNVQVMEAAPLLLNTGFEEITGDLQTGGLASCAPLYWTLRETTFDPSGSIVLTDSSVHGGSYAIEVYTSGAGKVYAFQNANITQPGTYQITAWVRRPNSGESAIPYISVYNANLGTVVQQTFPGVVAGGSYTEITATCHFPEALANPASVIVGAYSGTGSVLIDDVNFVRTGP